MGLVVCLISLCFLANKWRLFSPFREHDWKKALLVIVVGVLVTKVLTSIGGYVLLMEKGPEAETANQAALEGLPISSLVLFIDVVLLAPLAEEIFFRELIQGGMFKKGSIYGLVFASLLFGAFHGPTDLGSWIIYGGMGLSWGLVYMWGQKVEYAISVHMIHNLIGFLFMLADK